MSYKDAIESTNRMLAGYDTVEIVHGPRGQVTALFRKSAENPTCYSAGSFAVCGATGPIAHDVSSLGRFLTYHQGLEGLDTAAFKRWEAAYRQLAIATLKASVPSRPALRIAA